MFEKDLTIKDAARLLGVSPSLVYEWCREQLLPHYRYGGSGRRGKIMISLADLDLFKQQCRVDRHPLL